VRRIAREVAKSPAVIITEELGKNPQEEIILSLEADFEGGGVLCAAGHACS